LRAHECLPPFRGPGRDSAKIDGRGSNPLGGTSGDRPRTGHRFRSRGVSSAVSSNFRRRSSPVNNGPKLDGYLEPETAVKLRASRSIFAGRRLKVIPHADHPSRRSLIRVLRRGGLVTRMDSKSVRAGFDSQAACQRAVVREFSFPRNPLSFDFCPCCFGV